MNIKSLLVGSVASAVIAISAVGADTAPAAGQRATEAGPAGHWEANITGDGPQRIRVSLDLAKNAKSEWIASLGLPSDNMTGLVVKHVVFHFKNQPDKTVMTTFDTANATNLPLNDVKQTGQKVEFGMRIAHCSFQGTLNKEGTELAGQFTHEENSVPLTLRKKAGQTTK